MKNNNKPDRSLFSLEQSLSKRKSAPEKSPPPSAKQSKDSQEKAQVFDSGEAIELQYSQDLSATINPTVESFSAANSFASELEDESLPFEVEAFEESLSFETETFETETFEADNEVTSVSKPVEPQPQPPLQPENQGEALPEAMEARAAQPVEAKVVPSSETLPQPTRSVEQPTTTAPTTAPTTAQAELYDDQAFAADLQAVIKGEKTYDTEQKEIVSTSSPTQAAAQSTAHPHDIFDQRQTATSSPTTPPQPPVEPEPTSTSRSHAVFEQMGKNMAHATEFDRGTVDLSLEQRFDEFDRFLDQEESKSDRHQPPLALEMKKDPPATQSKNQKSTGNRRQDLNEQLESIGTTYTVCFSGTSCTRDEGEATRRGEGLLIDGSDPRIYSQQTGYIPVRIHQEISRPDNLRKTTDFSATVRGVGVNDWHDSQGDSEPLNFKEIPGIPQKLLDYVKGYSGGNQQGKGGKEITGWSAVALALHGANLAVASGAKQYNFIGHSRGAVECIMAAWFLYAYGDDEIKNIPVNIFAIDPVPGPGNWYGIFTQLPPNVDNYVGIYAWDHVDNFFTALVPRPNAKMSGQNKTPKLGKTWSTLADSYQLANPLEPNETELPQPTGYELYACRGKHSTVAGNITADGGYDQKNNSKDAERVPHLVYKLARAYLTKWGTTFNTPSAVPQSVPELRRQIHTFHREFDAMSGTIMGGGTRNITYFKPIRSERPYARYVSSSSSFFFGKTYFLEDVVGDPPYTLAYPVTIHRKGEGWVKWKFL